MSNQEIKAVLFDLGETLLSFGKFRVTRLFRQGARLSYDYLKSQSQPAGRFASYFWRNLIHLQIKRWLSAVTHKDFDALALVKSVGARKGVRLTEQQWEHLVWLWYEPLCKIAKVEPNICETLSRLKQAGLELGIVSNTFVNRCCLDRHLEQEGILDFFPVRIYSYEHKFRKPDVRMFKIAADKIGKALENILFVGDQIAKDIEPASRIGMQTVLKVNSTNLGKTIPAGTRTINHIAELPSLIEEINARTV